MKKAILFEPTLLAEVERKSPDLYEYYCHSAFSGFEFVDYGTLGVRTLMQKDIMEQMEVVAKLRRTTIDAILETLQKGYILGKIDMKRLFMGEKVKPKHASKAIEHPLRIAIKYPYYTMNCLLELNNYSKYDGIMYSINTYKEAMHHTIWEIFFQRHKEFNNVFKELNSIKLWDQPNKKENIHFDAEWN